jgi:hypothetical protein
MKRILITLLLVFISALICVTSGYAITSAGVSIETNAELTYTNGAMLSTTTVTTVEQMYGFTFESWANSAYDSPGATHYFPQRVTNLGNGTDNIRIKVFSSSTETWAISLIWDENNNGTHESGETSILSNPFPIGEDSAVSFFLAIKSPSTETTGASREVRIIATGEGTDGGYYFGANGSMYGGLDSGESTSILTVEALRNLKIHRQDDGIIYLTWIGGSADIHCVQGSFDATFASSTIEAANVPSPYTCNTLSKDGKSKYYRIALAGTQSFAPETVGKCDVSVEVGMNQLSSPFVLYDNEVKSLVGAQVTGSTLASAADTLWKYNAAATGSYDISWLVAGVGPAYDGKWYLGKVESNIKIGTDEGWFLQIRDSHAATYVSLVGEVASTNRTVPVSVGMNMVGSCFPITRVLTSSNLYESNMTGAAIASAADRLWTYNKNATGSYDIAWLVGGATINAQNPSVAGLWYTGNVPTTMKLAPGKGYWIEVRAAHNPFTWTYNKLY